MKGRFICCIAFIGVMLLSFTSEEQNWSKKNQYKTDLTNNKSNPSGQNSLLAFNISCIDVDVNCLSDIGGDEPTVDDTNCDEPVTFSMATPQYSPFLSMGNPETCDGAVYIVMWTATQICDPGGPFEETFTAECEQVVTLLGGAATTITCPASETVECVSDIMEGTATVDSECALGFTVATVGPTLATGTANCDGATYTIIYTVTDDCGDTAECTQTFTLSSAAPTITCPGNVIVECGEDSSSTATGVATATSSCGNSVTITESDTSVAGCGNTETITRTWTATDACGNVATCEQTITIADTTDPGIMCPANVSVECGDDTSSAATGVATGSDGCGTVSISESDAVDTTPCGLTEIITRTWTATDECGNTSICQQIITITDLTPPSITCPADVSVECGGDTSSAATGTATGSDGCGSISVSSFDTVIDQCGNTETISRTWIVSDDCDNSSVCTQTITVTDFTPPTITCPANTTLECGEDTSSASTGVATGTDGCGMVSISSFDTVIDQCGNTETISRTWIATDECDNSSVCAQTITVEDTTPPVITCPVDATVECGEDSTSASTGLATGIDGCGTVVITQSDAIDTSPCGLTGIITRTWTATDECDNVSTCEQIITIEDTTAPEVTCPLNETGLMCTDALPAGYNTPNDFIAGGGTITEGCGTTTVSFTDDGVVGDFDFCLGTDLLITRTYTITDACGNEVTCEQTFEFVADTEAPTVDCSVIEDMVFECGDPDLDSDIQTWLSAQETAIAGTATDNCNGMITVSNNYIVGAYPSEKSCGDPNMGLVVTFTIEDECGNAATCSGAIILEDTTPPLVDCSKVAMSLVLECNVDDYEAEIADWITHIETTVLASSGTVDNCTGALMISNNYVIGSAIPTDCDGNPNNGLMVEFVVSDCCDNMAPPCIGLIVVNDTTDPVITCPANVTVECGDDTSSSSTGVATGTDGCGGVMITQSDAVDTTPCGLTEVITRTWTATDDCGNTATCVQTITVEDTTDPVITCPANVTVECGEDTSSSSTGVATGTDGCGGVMITQSDAVDTTPCGLTEVITRTWTATDDCGNTSTCAQIITIEDTTPPMITCPADATVECGTDATSAATGVATGTDGCGGVMITQSDAIDTTPCGLTGIITRTWTATDDCGNISTCAQIITIEDTTPPMITCPVDATVECGTDATSATTGVATGTDGCGTVTITQSDAIDTTPCGLTGIITRTWTATDDCGNMSTCQQTITIEDTTAPEVTCPLNETGLMCNEALPAGFTNAADFIAGGGTIAEGCGSTTVNFTDDDDPANFDYCLGTDLVITRTYTITDDCGNESTCEQTFTYVPDTEAPMVDCSVVEDMVFECGEADLDQLIQDWLEAQEDALLATATDNCDGMISISNNYIVGSLPSEKSCGDPNMGLVITLIVEDECGNQNTDCFVRLILEDTTPPIADCSKAGMSLTLECGIDDYAMEIADWITHIETSILNSSGTGDNCTGALIITNNYTTGALPTLDCSGNPANGLEVEFVVSDCCGNMAPPCVGVIILNDTTGPVITCPANQTGLTCMDPVPTAATTVMEFENLGGVIVEDCGIATVTSSDDIDPTTFNFCTADGPFIVTRTYTVTDDCGNTATCEQTFTYEADTQAPVITCPPNETGFTCTDDLPAGFTTPNDFIAGGGTIDENCSITSVSFTDDGDPSMFDFCVGGDLDITRTYTITDECGNSSTCEQIFTFEPDTEAPMVDCSVVEDMVFECGDPDIDQMIQDWLDAQEDALLATATDNCNGTITISNNYIVGSLPSEKSCGDPNMGIVITLTVEDACGNQNTDCFVRLILEDTTPPEADCSNVGDPLILECGDPDIDQMIQDWIDEVSMNILDAPGTTDNCTGMLTVTTDYVVGTLPTLDCTGDPNNGLEVEFYVEDCCGNQSTPCIGIIVLDDMTPPVIACPADIEVECGESTDSDDTGMPTATDACGTNVTFSESDTSVDECGGTEVITRTWTATDGCGNTSTCEQIITVVDNVPPVIDPMAMDMTVECEEGSDPIQDFQDWLDDNGGAVATDECGGGITWTNSSVGLSDGCGDTGMETVVFTATDECGNSATTSATFTIEDNTPPTIDVEAEDLKVECNAETTEQSFQDWLDDNGGAEASDACGEVTWTNDGMLSDDCGGSGFSFVTFTATDECGNTATTQASFFAGDETPPEITEEAMDMSVECDGTSDPLDAFQDWLDDNAGAMAEDLCGEITWTNNSMGLSDDCGITGMETVTFFATDECDNTSETEATFTITDMTPPEITCPVNVDVECGDSTDPADTGMPTGTDVCGGVTFTFADGMGAGDCGPMGAILRTWTATDECGNTATCEQTIDIVDTTDPIITCPPNVVDLTCNDDLPAAATNEQEFLDQMGTIIEVCNVATVTSVDDPDPSTFTFCVDDGPFVVTRTYTVTDGCGNSDTCEQTFTYLADEEAPVLTCPVDMTFGTDDGVCNADVTIDPPAFVENCSMVSLVNDYNNTNNASDNYPLGDTEVTWTATDECGNESTCSHTVTIEDDESPVITCNDNVCVILEDNGTAFIAATTFLNSATDNCSTVFTVEGMVVGQGPLGAGITFNCMNKGPVMVMLVVTDDAGNSASCTVDVEVKDTTAPGQELGGISTCPSDLNISCNVIVDFDNMTQFGTIVFNAADQSDIIIDGVVVGQDGLFTDNCPDGLVIQSINVNSDDYDESCNTGIITRTFIVSDASGNTSSCTQTITSINDDPFVCTDVIWPDDYETDNCEVEVIDPDESGRPTYPSSSCSLLGQSFEDQVFNNPLSGCMIIERTWTVIDWCQYESNVDDPLGYCQDVQTIMVVNSVAPVIETCMDTMICSNPFTCIGNLNITLGATDDCTDDDDLVYNWSINVNNDGITFINGVGSTIMANVSMGTHTITWSVEDHCGNVSECVFVADVQDCKAPTVACKYGLSTTLLPKNGGCVTIWANDFVQSISDNCTDVEDLSISFSADITDTSIKFTCDDLGQQFVEVWVTDEDGNQSFCNTFIEIQDNLDVCDGGSGNGMVMIAGKIATEEDAGLNLAGVMIDALGMSDMEMTDSLGAYAFFDLPMGEDYNIAPEKDDNHDNGVSTIDLVIIQKHLLDIAPITSPYKLIAADADNSEHISSIDLIQIRKLILGVYDEFPSNTSWRFVDEKFVFPEPSNPWPFEEEVMNADMAADAMAVNFVAVKIGDVNGTVETNVSSVLVENRSANPLQLILENKEFSAGEIVTVDLSAEDFIDIVALQYTMDYDESKLEYIAIESANLNVTEANVASLNKDNKVLTFSWNGVDGKTVKENETICRISFMATANGSLENTLTINSDVTAALAFDSNYEERAVVLRYNESSALYSLHQNAPNPFMDKTEIGFTIPTRQEVTLMVYDAAGKLLWQHSDVYDAGDHSYPLTKDDLNGTAGMLYLEISANGFSDTRKMIMLK